MLAIESGDSPGNAARRMAVAVAPGLTQFTRIFSVDSVSAAKICAIPSVANFDAA